MDNSRLNPSQGSSTLPHNKTEPRMRASWFDDYQDVCRLYPNAALFVKLYSALRFLICPFGLVEAAVPKAGVIVDFGCGYGLFANLLAIRSATRQVIGCDIDAKRIKTAYSSIADRRNVSFFASENNVSLPPCDAITMVDVLHHMRPDVRAGLLQEAFRKLTPGGHLLVKDIDTVPRAKYIWNYVHDLIMTRFGACYYLGKTEMCNLLQQAGFAVVAEPLQTHQPYSHILYRCRKNP
jgi:2-polyprenyl-3-methyl-5-hydroxy-6-metoxy-1,4-benzoquinol methylase